MTGRPIRATVDAAALRDNYARAKRVAGAARVFATVKANGYGHGLLRVVRALAGADGYALCELDDAIRLREAGVRQPLLLLEGWFSPAEVGLYAQHALMPVIHTAEQIAMLAGARLPRPLDVHVKLNSGMNRLGFAPDAYAGAVHTLLGHPLVASVTLMTHFASADEAEGIAAQMQVFERATQGLGLPRSLANSAALLRYPESHGEQVRPGIMLYGVSPFADRDAGSFGLVPAMRLESELIATQQLRAGDRVGYGGAFVAERPMRIGVVAGGYGDGYPRSAPTGSPVLVGGRRTRTVGRVSMDMLAVDLEGLPQAAPGTPVLLWGPGLPVEEVAAAAGTISYELLCAVAPRVPVFES